MAITTYAQLQTSVATWLDRSDLTAVVPDFIALAEAGFRRDRRCRKLQDRGTFSVSADGATLPTDLQSLEAWWHDGPTYYGPIEVVGADQLGTIKARMGETGAPRFAALVDGVAYFAPEPDATYDTRMTYWRTVESLSDTVTTNWLLASHPDLYLYGSLVEASPYLKDDERVALWQMQLDVRLEQLHAYTWNRQMGGTMRRQHRAFGG